MQRRDPYEILGVSKTASVDEIRKAYRQAALKHHPDRNMGDPESAARFKEATEAFQILSDDEKRAIFDQYGYEGLEGRGGFGPGIDLGDLFGNFQDLFSDFFGGGGRRGGKRKGPDIRVTERLTLRESVNGCKKELNVRFPSPCDACHGSGAAPGSSPQPCGTCRGSGQVASQRGFMVFTQTCPKCGGEGQIITNPCKSCKGSGLSEKTKKIVVSFPAGLDDGQALRLAGQGGTSAAGGAAGDLLVVVQVQPDDHFERREDDLITRVNVPLVDAIVGTRVEFQNLDDERIGLDLAPGTKPGHVITLRGKGVPAVGDRGRGRGNLHVVIEVQIPSIKELSPRGRELVMELQKELGRS